MVIPSGQAVRASAWPSLVCGCVLSSRMTCGLLWYFHHAIHCWGPPVGSLVTQQQGEGGGRSAAAPARSRRLFLFTRPGPVSPLFTARRSPWNGTAGGRKGANPATLDGPWWAPPLCTYAARPVPPLTWSRVSICGRHGPEVGVSRCTSPPVQTAGRRRRRTGPPSTACVSASLPGPAGADPRGGRRGCGPSPGREGRYSRSARLFAFFILDAPLSLRFPTQKLWRRSW